MNDEQYRDHCLKLLSSFAELLEAEARHCSETDPLKELAEAFSACATGPDLYDTAPGLIARLFASCPHLAPAFPRELLWFLGGDCLHYMPDDELLVFQQLDEERAAAAAAGEVFDYAEARANSLKLQ